ncbi:MAG: hypothetical protein Q7S22_01900 [Candidatus Micrarchaeota archaeon]|nr:hypothetical protein [Candidatus Micrarchaeota archaeon]
MVMKKGKVVDKWKLKKWYTVQAPQMFDNKEICEIVASDDKLLVNRLIKVSLMELLGSSSQTAMFTTLFFRVIDVKGNVANTKFISHQVAPSFIRTFARRGKTLLHCVIDAPTKDNESVRLKFIIVTAGKISENTKRSLRNALVEEVKKFSPEFNYDALMQEILYGRLVSKLFNRLKQITALRRIEIRKSERKETFK